MTKKLLVITGATSSGKTYIERLAYSSLGVRHVQTATTRSPRYDDSEGYYSYLTETEFCKMVDGGHFVESARYGKNYYGTPVPSLLHMMHSSCMFWSVVVESQGAMSIGRYFAANKNLFDNFEVACLILSADHRTLLKRLIKRSFLSNKRKPDNLEKLATDTAMRIEDIMEFDAAKLHSKMEQSVELGLMGYSDVWLQDNVGDAASIIKTIQDFYLG